MVLALLVSAVHVALRADYTCSLQSLFSLCCTATTEVPTKRPWLVLPPGADPHRPSVGSPLGSTLLRVLTRTDASLTGAQLQRPS